jgi:hypothetical protein
MAVGSEMWTVGSGQWVVERSMKLLPSDVHQSHERPKHHRSDWSQGQCVIRFLLEKQQIFIMSELHSTQFRNKNSFEHKDRFCRHKIPLCSVTAWWSETELTDSDTFICSFHLS